ncbi:hypothetical protein AS850_14375 [Frondihabitans sp. 762G35]|uniref:hypothetical protein n=1 Tax=Frondihabitans sp. 762G35 TaxID=1446794 RepID=UPI000D203F61|nr:hypothetical protein [Frondihabitans sp. 762G35]ARC58268.1 hypothetical protein AS850_14375 [Frondihabitans sp. 762G35]
MKGKILFVAGLAAGYVVGARAGRQSYEKIKLRADKVWHDPNVQRGVTKAEDFVAEKAPIVGRKIQETAQDAAHAATEKVRSATSKSDPETPKL